MPTLTANNSTPSSGLTRSRRLRRATVSRTEYSANCARATASPSVVWLDAALLARAAPWAMATGWPIDYVIMRLSRRIGTTSGGAPDDRGAAAGERPGCFSAGGSAAEAGLKPGGSETQSALDQFSPRFRLHPHGRAPVLKVFGMMRF